jgi:hypothetical protein
LKEFHALRAVSRFAVSNIETLKQAAKPHETLTPLKLLKQLKHFKQ